MTDSLSKKLLYVKSLITQEGIYSEYMATHQHYDKAEVSGRLQWLMDQHGWKQRELAKRSGVSQKSISNIININSEREYPKIDTIEKIAGAFGVSSIWLLYGINPEYIVENKEVAAFMRMADLASSDELGFLKSMFNAFHEFKRGEQEDPATPNRKSLPPPHKTTING